MSFGIVVTNLGISLILFRQIQASRGMPGRGHLSKSSRKRGLGNGLDTSCGVPPLT